MTDQTKVQAPAAWMLGTRLYRYEKDALFDWRNDAVFENTGYVPIALVSQSDAAAIIAGKDEEIARLRAEVERLTELERISGALAHKAFDSVVERDEQSARIAELERDRKEDAGNLAKLLRAVKYFIGIAERGTGNPCPVDQSAESFVLEYVKGLEALIAAQSAALAKAWGALSSCEAALSESQQYPITLDMVVAALISIDALSQPEGEKGGAA